MAKAFAFMLWTITYAGIFTGTSLTTAKPSTACGDWTPYKDEKCLKIADKAGAQTQEDAEVICKSFADELNKDSVPKLLTIKTAEEQQFVQRFLFVDNELVDNFWLGLKKKPNSHLFEWNDGSKLSFSNWANQTTSDNEHECAELESGDGAVEMGFWFRVNCKRKNAIVCERPQLWKLGTLQNAVLISRLEQENQQKEIKTLKQEIATLKNNPVPIGFIYAQLPQRDPPTVLWPMTQWADVSSNYAGLFFRVAGGNAAQFGQTQEATSPKLQGVKTVRTNDAYAWEVSVSDNGYWTGNLFVGGDWGGRIIQQFYHSTAEVRPRNQAMIIWQRVK